MVECTIATFWARHWDSYAGKARETRPMPGGGTQLFSGRGVQPGFPKCEACELIFTSKKGGLWTENLKFGGLWAKIWVKIEAGEAEISKFSQKGVLWTDSFAWNGALASSVQERREKGVFRAAHPHTPFLGQSPPPPPGLMHIVSVIGWEDGLIWTHCLHHP